MGAETGTLTITDNAANSPQTASLTGTGITPVTVSSSTLNLPSAAVGNTSAVTTVTTDEPGKYTAEILQASRRAGLSPWPPTAAVLVLPRAPRVRLA